MCDRELARYVVSALVIMLAGCSSSEDSLCSRLSAEDRVPRPEQSHLRTEDGVAGIAEIFARLADPDPLTRAEAVGRLGSEWAESEPFRSTLENRKAMDRRLAVLLRRESDRRVLRRVLRSTCLRSNSNLAPLLVELNSCEAAGSLRSDALECAATLPGIVTPIRKIGTPDSEAFLGEVFERVGPEHQGWIADHMIRSRIESRTSRRIRFPQPVCTHHDETEPEAIERLRRDAARLLDPSIERYYGALRDCHRALETFNAFSRHLDPDGRVEHWRSVRRMAGGALSRCASDASPSEPDRLLALALVRRASSRADTDPDSATRDLQEAADLGIERDELDLPGAIARTRARVERIRSGVSPSADPERFAGRYVVRTGYTSREIDLARDGTYSQVSRTDHDYYGCWTSGTYHVAGDTVVLAPAPRFARDHAEVVRSLFAVESDGRSYLVPERVLGQFCEWVRYGSSGRSPALARKGPGGPDPAFPSLDCRPRTAAGTTPSRTAGASR